MAVTADLPPGARVRMWILLAVTATIGIGTWWVFGRTLILWVSLAVLSVLIYLLLGVHLALRQDYSVFEPLVAGALKSLGAEPHWLILANNGTILHISDAGAKALAHDSAILEGQQLGDLVPMEPASTRVTLQEMLRFGASHHQWTGELTVTAEDGSLKQHTLKTLYLGDNAARRAGIIALGPAN